MAYPQMNEQTLRAVDVQAAVAIIETHAASNLPRISPIALAKLPITEDLPPRQSVSHQAVLSWRWDVEETDGTSCNVTAVLVYASSVGIDHLFVDAVSVDQTLTGLDLMRSVAEFTSLFGKLPVIAAYDTKEPKVDTRHFLRVLRRPWIAREILAMRKNPHQLRYIGHISGQGTADAFGFAHMVKRVWNTSFANSFLYVLTGYCDLYDVSELPLILPEYELTLTAAVGGMCRNDALISAAILSQLSKDDVRVNGDINLREVDMESYSLVPAEGSVGFWSNWEIVLDGKSVGLWSEKDYTRDGSPRRKFSANNNAHELLGVYLDVEIGSEYAIVEEDTPPHPTDNVTERIETINLADRFTV